MRPRAGSRTMPRTKKTNDEARTTFRGIGSRSAGVSWRLRAPLAPFERFPSLEQLAPFRAPFTREPRLSRRQTRRTRPHCPRPARQGSIPENASLPRHRQNLRPLPRMDRRSHSSAEARRGRCPVQHAVADERRREGEGQVGVIHEGRAIRADASYLPRGRQTRPVPAFRRSAGIAIAQYAYYVRRRATPWSTTGYQSALASSLWSP